jgi:hypothetical protein
MVRLILQLSIRKLGTNNKALLNSLKFIVGVEQAAAWESAGTAISQIFRNIPLGKSAFDPLNGTTPDTMAGRELITQLHGDPTRVDSILLKNWGMATTKALGTVHASGIFAVCLPGYLDHGRQRRCFEPEVLGSGSGRVLHQPCTGSLYLWPSDSDKLLTIWGPKLAPFSF